MDINWDSFKTYNQYSGGIRFIFEDLCRQLFSNENLSGNKQFRFLHANPNNPGLETEPIYDEVNQKWIGFQAKYFDGDVDYRQIKHSADEIVENYTGKKGIVELVYIFSNKPITSTARGMVETVELLKDNNIEIQLITDNAILDLVRDKYPYLGFYYFGNHTLNPEWFSAHAAHMFDELGERYDRAFNVDTDFLYELSLFLHDQTAADYVNSKKIKLLEKVEETYQSHWQHRDYLSALREATESLSDVNIETLYDSITWHDSVSAIIKPYVDGLSAKREELERKRDKAFTLSYDDSHSKECQKKAQREYQETGRQLHEIVSLLELPYEIEITEREQRLLKSNVLALNGRAGSGKSQLLAYKTNSLLAEDRTAILLVAGIYFSNDPIQEQIMSHLRLDYSFEDLIDVLEAIGERDNCIVPLFIDALNETWNNKLWETGLPLIIERIKQAPMVRLVFSYRPEYAQTLFTDAIQEEITKGDIVTVFHKGFDDNQITAVREFLNHYSIPFTPVEYFDTEMSNPLFLKLYCKTYNGEEVGLPSLYERLAKRVSKQVYHALKLHLNGFSESDDVLSPLIIQMAAQMISNGRRSLTKADLLKLGFWSEYGFAPAPFIGQIVKEGLLYNYIFDEDEYYFFAYDQMNDYYCAKAVLIKYREKTDVREYLANHILKIENGELRNPGNIDLFVNACAIYAEKYGEECIDIIDTLKNEYDQWEVFSRYISSYQWRSAGSINKEVLYSFLKKYPCSPENLWSMLIGNSIKVHHPLNADFLHEFLSTYELNRRDYLWTVYINKLPSYEENRVVQLIEMYDRGEKLDNTSEKQTDLLLTLLGWMLTSSNRWLRDYTSKAMIEILKEQFQLCQPILEKFSDVNDPYVIQRIYGVVFGACCKRTSGDLQQLAEYVYEAVFNQEKVYPDILLRDYARLIVERFLWENPSYNGIIKHERIVPPYKSDPIPVIEDQHYEDKKLDTATSRLVMSMRIEKMGWYGDFGRYVFQSALSNFDVDCKEMFNYALYFILNDLGFNEEYFGEHDRHCGSYDRYLTAKTERIGKKYQWIALYNMLARISDNCKMIERWALEDKEVHFEGAWEPYVRDFDPTLNTNFMVCSEAPVFGMLEAHKERGIAENNVADTSDDESQKAWLEERGVFFRDLKDTLILTDELGLQWVCLTKYCDTRRKSLSEEKLLVWSYLYAYFVSPEQAEAFAQNAEKGLSIITHDTASNLETYSIFNREYPWSPSCRELKEYEWVDAYIKTGETETIIETVQLPDLSSIEAILQKYCGLEFENEESLDDAEENESNEDEFEIPQIQYKEVEQKREIEKEIGCILHATAGLLWEEEYDATKEEPISRRFPCPKLVEVMNLKQIKADGFFFDAEGKLAAFDTKLTQQVDSVVVRKDILDVFLERTRMKLMWLIDAEKQVQARDHSKANWSDWEAVYVYEGDTITGEIHKLQHHNNW